MRAGRADETAPAAPLRATAALLLVAGTALGLLGTVEHLWHRALSPGAPIDDVVTLAVVSLGAVAALALVPGCALLCGSAVARSSGRRLRACERAAERLTPAALRRLVAVGLGAGLGLGLVAPAAAQEMDLGWEPTAAAGGHQDMTTTAAQATTAQATAARDAPAQATDTSDRPVGGTGTGIGRGRTVSEEVATGASPTVVVAPGDSLWTIAAEHLEDPSAGAVARAWPVWFEANRDVIEDPDLIHPGQRLRVPDPNQTQELR